jgi:protein-disulfide isomerase
MFRTALRVALLILPLLLAACGPKPEAQAPQEEAANVAETDMVLGSPDAPVTIIEYASVTCPICAMVHKQVLPQIKEKYIDTGNAKLIFREFPAHNPALSIVGSMLARCVAEKGGKEAYFSVVSTLFNTQQEWAEGSNPKQELEKIAAQAGMDGQAFDACIQRQDLLDLINENTRVAQDEFQVNGTPTFIVGGEKLGAARTITGYEDMLDNAISAAVAKTRAQD